MRPGSDSRATFGLTYVQLLQSELVPALVFFERTHAWLFLPMVLLIDVSLGHAEPSPGARRLRRALRVTMLIAGVALLVAPSCLSSRTRSPVLCGVSSR